MEDKKRIGEEIKGKVKKVEKRKNLKRMVLDGKGKKEKEKNANERKQKKKERKDKG